jgi:hypothetical protein
MPYDEAERNLRMFTQEVMPRVRAETGAVAVG